MRLAEVLVLLALSAALGGCGPTKVVDTGSCGRGGGDSSDPMIYLNGNPVGTSISLPTLQPSGSLAIQVANPRPNNYCEGECPLLKIVVRSEPAGIEIELKEPLRLGGAVDAVLRVSPTTKPGTYRAAVENLEPLPCEYTAVRWVEVRVK